MAHTSRGTAPKGAASQAQLRGVVGAQATSQAHRHSNGDNGFPATIKDKKGKARGKEEKGTAQKAKEKAKEEDR